MKYSLVILFSVLFLGCNNSIVEKPKNLIDEDQMIEIIYDISLLDALKNQNIATDMSYPSTTELLKTKYKVDSLTFAKSSQYYASDYKKYKKIYEKVKIRLEEETKKINGGNPVPLNEEEGIVK
jgi:hypothetical protein